MRGAVRLLGIFFNTFSKLFLKLIPCGAVHGVAKQLCRAWRRGRGANVAATRVADR